jgi:hypothetical protein
MSAYDSLHADWTTTVLNYNRLHSDRYPKKCSLITHIHGNVFRNELVSKNPSLRKRVFKLVS